MTPHAFVSKVCAWTETRFIARIKSLEPAIRAEGVAHLAIFGSRARGTQNQVSDLDVLIDIDPGSRFSLLNLSGVGLLIEGATGIPAQVVLKRSAEPAFMTRIAGDLARIF